MSHETIWHDICDNKGGEADQRLCFRYKDHEYSIFSSKFAASGHLLCLYSSVFVRPVRKPHRWFSHEVAHFVFLLFQQRISPL